MTETKSEMKEKIAEMIRILAAGEILTLMKGHLSYRLPGTNEILILGHAHRSGKTLAEITGDDIVTIDLNGHLLEGSIQPPGERFINTCIYRKRQDVGAVIHAHPHASMPFAVAGIQIIPVHHEAIAFAPAVELLDYAGQIDAQKGDDGRRGSEGPRRSPPARSRKRCRGTGPRRDLLQCLRLGTQRDDPVSGVAPRHPAGRHTRGDPEGREARQQTPQERQSLALLPRKIRPESAVMILRVQPEVPARVALRESRQSLGSLREPLARVENQEGLQILLYMPH